MTKTIILKSSLRHATTKDANEINQRLYRELAAGRPVYVKIPTGVFAGSIGRLKITESISDLSRVLVDIGSSASSYGPTHKFRVFDWEVEVDGCSRNFKIAFDKFTKYYQYRNYHIEVYLGRTEGTLLIKKKPDELVVDDFLIDMLGRKINAGDYVLINPGPAANQNNEALRLVQWTGSQTQKQGYFRVAKMSNEFKKQRTSGSKYRIGLHHTDNGMMVPGVRVDVCESLSTSLPIVEHDVSNFNLKFSVEIDV